MNVIEVKDVYKKFKIYLDKGSTLKEKILFAKRTRFEERWVLRGVSLNITKGETVALIGENGCGKSTLLKLLTKIIYPNEGKIKIKGRVSSLLELGAGFHQDMTGRENIYNNASIFGLSKQEIDGKLKDIIEFSELGSFIDNPVRTYSSGMYTRLAFSIAINVNADILLIDEILAVGDIMFQKKCIEKMIELKNSGITIVFVSHDNSMVERLCSRAVWIKDGLIKSDGKAKEVINDYLDYVSEKNNIKSNEEKHELNEYSEVDTHSNENDSIEDTKKSDSSLRWGNKYIEITNTVLLDKNNVIKTNFNSNEKIKILIEYKINRQINDIVFGIGIFRDDEVCCYGTNTYIDKFDFESKSGRIAIDIPNVNLLKGKYFLDVASHDRYGIPYDYIKKIASFNIETRTDEVGIIRLEHKWIEC
ncbi:ABC transporter ATP-binding protein [Clostridium sp. DJ247]|uniref:ABC transporter ATP-binding protein n=1 Tax=Clostridium sp. DJ247 TaxID=2726188 RepID=UPI00162386E0|nr:ABC transporter ATP-binding protein [Clostridium sp. DJ247]MBC2581573.1 ABC transporter ATP-binding protein [Clostridium sp. DJ247]